MGLSTLRAERYRKPHPTGLPHKRGDDYGWFEVRLKAAGPALWIMASPANGEWEFDHVSVSMGARCPTWEEMCWVKNLFFEPEDCVVQYHPPESEYVNMARHCLHLWCWRAGDFPKPKKIEVGI